MDGSYNEMVRLSGKDLNDLGNFKACNELAGAKYVLVSTYVFFQMSVGLCIPESCEKDDLELLKDTLSSDFFNFGKDTGDRRRRLESKISRLPGLSRGRRLKDEKEGEMSIWFTFPEEEFDDELGNGGVLMVLIMVAIGVISLSATFYDILHT